MSCDLGKSCTNHVEDYKTHCDVRSVITRPKSPTITNSQYAKVPKSIGPADPCPRDSRSLLALPVPHRPSSRPYATIEQNFHRHNISQQISILTVVVVDNFLCCFAHDLKSTQDRQFAGSVSCLPCLLSISGIIYMHQKKSTRFLFYDSLAISLNVFVKKLFHTVKLNEDEPIHAPQ